MAATFNQIVLSHAGYRVADDAAEHEGAPNWHLPREPGRTAFMRLLHAVADAARQDPSLRSRSNIAAAEIPGEASLGLHTAVDLAEDDAVLEVPWYRTTRSKPTSSRN